MGDIILADKGLVGCIKEQQSSVFAAIVDPYFQLAAGECGAGRIVGITQIYHIGIAGGESGDETVFGRAWQIFYRAPASVGSELAGASGHHVCVDIYGIYRIGDSYTVGCREYVADIAGVAFGTVADEDFILGHFYAVASIVIIHYLADEKIVALLGTIAVKSLTVGFVVDRAVESVDHSRAERAGDVTDAHAYHFSFGVSLRIDSDPACHLAEQI